MPVCVFTDVYLPGVVSRTAAGSSSSDAVDGKLFVWRKNTTSECALRVEHHPVCIIFNHNSTMPSSHTYLMALIPKLLLRTRVKYLHRSVQTLWDYYHYFFLLLLFLLLQLFTMLTTAG